MSVIYIALPMALVLAGLAIWGFIRAVRQGQYDDLDTPALRMLHDDEPAPRPPQGTTGEHTADPESSNDASDDSDLKSEI